MIFWEKKLNTRFEAGAITWLAYQFNGEPQSQLDIAKDFQMSETSIGTILHRLFEYPPDPKRVKIYQDTPSRYERAMETIRKYDASIN